MLSSCFEKLAILCFSQKTLINTQFLRCFSVTSGVVNEGLEWIKSENTLKNMEIKGQAVLKRYIAQSPKTLLKNNFIAVKLYLMRDLEIDPVVLSRLVNDIPEVYQCDVDDIRSWVELLLQYSFARSQIIELVQKYPWLFVIPAQKIAKTFYDLLQQIEITRLELPSLCCSAPCVLADDAEVTVQKHLYLHFIMSHRDFSEVVNSGVFNFSLYHIRLRHQFLHRRGQFFQYSRHGSSKIQNPSLEEMFCSSDEKFCEEVAYCDLQEYFLFQKLFLAETRLEERVYADAANAKMFDIKASPESKHDDDDDYTVVSSDKTSLADELAKHL